MSFFNSPARALRSILLSTMLVFGLSACAPAVRVNLSAPVCFTQMVEASGLARPTPHAALPENSSGAWVDFGNRESGQLDVANAEKAGIVGIGQTCDRWNAEAAKKVNRKRFLGIF